MFSSAKKKLIDQKLMEQQDLAARKKQYAQMNSRNKVDPQLMQQYIMAYIQMKDLENYYYTRCTSMCVNLKEDLLNDKERECLNDCNRKISKYIGIARKQFQEYEDDIKSVQKIQIQ